MPLELKEKGLMLLLYTSVVINILMMFVILYITCVKTDVCSRMLVKVGLVDYNPAIVRHGIEYRCLDGWANSLNKLNVGIDAVFFGNSITYESNFQEYFPEIKICNLGCNRDDLDDLIHRSFTIKSVHPHKIFILGGINNFMNVSLDEFKQKYSNMLDIIMKQNPYAQIYLQSLLPVNVEMDIGSRYVDCQEKIKEANAIIRNLSKVKGCIFVDLYSAYQVNDSMPRKYTRDGLHLYPEAYSIWARVICNYLKE